MRAMILAAGLGTRLLPLTRLLPKPAMPIRGLPTVAYLMELAVQYGVKELVMNVHHLPDAMERAARTHLPPSATLALSPESAPLGTGGGIRRAAGFLRESPVSVVMAGDMLLDLDLGRAVARHREREARVTLVLRDDPRAKAFGTIGVDDEGCIRRIGTRFDLGGETTSGVFIGLRVFSSVVYETLPTRDDFEDLSDWIAPQLRAGARDICAQLLSRDECVWEPVGTMQEYLHANLTPPRVSYLSEAEVLERGGAEIRGDLIVGARARLEAGARLERSIIWEDEVVPSKLVASDGVFAGGVFHRVPDEARAV